MSPLKSYPVSNAKPNYGNLNYIPIPPPAGHMNLYTDSPMKRAHVDHARQYRPQPMVQQPMFTTFNSNFETFDQENFVPYPTVPDNFVDFPDSSYARKQPLKRSYSDVISSNDRPFKKARTDDEVVVLPEPEDMPLIEDDGNKPSYSYAQMIGMAILRAPNRRLTLAQIYEWISNTFAYYREDTKQGWHNSIRHNLSLNKAFKKQERPKGDAGKGSYWVIEPGMEMTFIKDKSRKVNNIANITIHSNIMRHEPMSVTQPLSATLAPSPFIVQSNTPRPQTAPALPELSSDATLPASDPALNEDDPAGEVDTNVIPQPQSSPPDAINSSPPVPVASQRRIGSSPVARHLPSAPVLQQKRHTATMDDSGYFSSIESSVLRPNTKSNIILTSELDIQQSRKKQRGRAEEEIVRIRSSSRDITPSHGRFRNSINEEMASSSPARPSPLTRLNPVTPSVVFKKPLRPPPSISPNTQLHMHRRAMQEFTNSPIKGFGLWNDDTETFSPFKWSVPQTHTGNEEFEIFSDPAIACTPAAPLYVSSPIRSSNKRGSLTKATITANVLSEVLGNAHRLNAKAPSRAALLKSPSRTNLTGSPLKSSMNTVNLLDEHDELFDFGSFDNENSDDDGVDILKGFGKIGGATTSHGTTNGLMQRPPMGARSFTSRF